MRRTVLLLTLLTTLGACRDDDRKAFELSGRVFIFNPRLAEATYVITLRPLGAEPRAAKAAAVFENPAGGDAIRVEQKIWPKATKVTLESPPVFCIVKDREYRVSISVLDDRGAVLQTIDTTVMSTLDQSVLPDRPLVIGPAYDANPELEGNAAGKLPGVRAPCRPPQ